MSVKDLIEELDKAELKIPDSCANCTFGKKYGLVGDVYCRICGKYFTGNVNPPHKEKPDECPLLEICKKRGKIK